MLFSPPEVCPQCCLENLDEENLSLYINETADRLFVNAKAKSYD